MSSRRDELRQLDGLTSYTYTTLVPLLFRANRLAVVVRDPRQRIAILGLDKKGPMHRIQD